MADPGGVYRVLVGKPEGRYHLEDLDIDVIITLIWTFKKSGGGTWTEWIWFRIQAGSRHLWMW